MVYVSITGLRLKRFYHAPIFWWHAIRSMRQAGRAEGNLSTDARTIRGVHHTLSVWTSRAAMRDYIASGDHLKAMKRFHDFGTGAVHGYEAVVAPDWGQARALWEQHGRAV